MSLDLKRTIKDKARQLGFSLAGVTLPDPPIHFSTFENWLAQGRHGNMDYLANERSRTRRADPREILPECKSILVLATPYHPPPRAERTLSVNEVTVEGQSFCKFELRLQASLTLGFPLSEEYYLLLTDSRHAIQQV